MVNIPNFLIPHFRTNHAGETGAVFIYKGILLLSKDQDILDFSSEHLKTEQGHLNQIEKIVIFQTCGMIRTLHISVQSKVPLNYFGTHYYGSQRDIYASFMT